jgi:hypothetical protein
VLQNIGDNYPDCTHAVQEEVSAAYVVACGSGFFFFKFLIKYEYIFFSAKTEGTKTSPSPHFNTVFF